MHSFFHSLSFMHHAPQLWDDTTPVRKELFGIERLEQHAESLASAQPISLKPPRVTSLQARLRDNDAVLLAAYRICAREQDNDQGVVPAAEWLLDNYHLVEEQIREIKDDLPSGYYRQLPMLANGPFAGYPRVFGIAWAYIAHTDSHFDPEILRRFVAAYQHVQPLTIGELWAIAITLRIVLIENLRRLADQITKGRSARAEAEAIANRLVLSGTDQTAYQGILAGLAGPLSELFVAQLAKRLRNQDPLTTPILGWLENRLKTQGTSIDEVVQHTHLRQGASNVTIRNVITSMRSISNIDWSDLFERMSLVDDVLRSGSTFATMDFATRNLYRSAIEQLAHSSSCSELEIAKLILLEAHQAGLHASNMIEEERTRDPGYHLIAEGRPHLEQIIHYQPPLRQRISRLHIRFGLTGYIGSLVVGTALLLWGAVWLLSPSSGAFWALFLLIAVGCIPMSELAISLLNRAITLGIGASVLPALELKDGVPQSLRTMIVVPTLLTSETDILEQIERIEVHYLGNPTGDLFFALLSDDVDADQEILANDAYLRTVATMAIAGLNSRYGQGPEGPRFLLLHRHRLFNASEQTWMGWERKRGKLHELNRLLRGATDTSFCLHDGQIPAVPAHVRYVITLDADTRLPRDAASRLIGKMAHPLNKPRISADEQRVVGGYAILQPRVTPSLPVGQEGSFYQRTYSGPSGIDPYAAAMSDVYQELFGEGSYAGKGIYDVDAFEFSLEHRIPENSLLSHDLFEGVFARAGLASDIEVIEDFPARYDVAAKRQHRWIRGDWQLLPWIFNFQHGNRHVPCVGRWKMFDNLRRSLITPSAFLLIVLSWQLPAWLQMSGTLLIFLIITIPLFLPLLFTIIPFRKDVAWRHHMYTLGRDLFLASSQAIFYLIFLPDRTWRMLDAIGRTLFRLAISHQHLLEWTTAAQASRYPRLDLIGCYLGMRWSTLLSVILAAVTMQIEPSTMPAVLPCAMLWFLAPALAWWISRAPTAKEQHEVPSADIHAFRLIARRTWRFFETFVTPADNMLPPDNFQEDPKPVIAHRTSPTNMGLYLLSAVAARDFGWAGTLATMTRLELTLKTMQSLQRFNGHFLNWYATQDLRALDPPYISSVDSGNLAGHLIVLANACEEWLTQRASISIPEGLIDTCQLAREAFAAQLPAITTQNQPVLRLLSEIENRCAQPQPLETLLIKIEQLANEAAHLTHHIIPPMEEEPQFPNLSFWVTAVKRAIDEHIDDLRLQSSEADTINVRLHALAHTARDMAMSMNFHFLLDPERKLLSIGFSVQENRLDSSCYDLLASEARLASLFAIAKGDVSTKHWFRLGRAVTPLGRGSALISWSGSMFEYLMPSLVIRAPDRSLIEQTTSLIVQRQMHYGRTLHIPWGVSESAYNARDIEFTYQYSNFGVPGLGLKRGLSTNVVIAPYATALAAMVAPAQARQNFQALEYLGASGTFGFYEALDFTRSRLPDEEAVVIIRSYMAHHQGMTVVALANVIDGGRMRARFHREPMIQACELLLQERIPRNIAITYPRVEEVNASVEEATSNEAPFVRHFVAASLGGAPVTHLLSNGSYAVMLTTAGAGYSRWGDIAVTRWREDVTRDQDGSFIFLRDTQSHEIWSASLQPMATHTDEDEIIFSEDRAEYIHQHGKMKTTLDVLVSGEDDGEVRRITLTNSGRRYSHLELTSYAELVLTHSTADMAHPAFSKLFVVTEYLEECGAIIATRRPRSAQEPQIWAAHLAVVEGDIFAPAQYESDRARFIGRGNSVSTADVIRNKIPLSNTTGTVLDAIFSIRQSVRVPPGKTCRVAFWTLIASSRDTLIALIDKHHDRNAFDRARTLAWTQAQVQLRHLAIDTQEAAIFQQLAAPILYADPAFRTSSTTMTQGAGAQSGLWPLAISGDLPIVLLRIDDIEDMEQVRQLLRAHEYWRMKRLAVDLVILNERASSYVQDLQIAIDTAIRSSQSRPRFGANFTQASVYGLRSDLISAESRALLISVARIVLQAHRGSLDEQLSLMATVAPPIHRIRHLPIPTKTWISKPLPIPDHLEFFNGLGGFDKQGKEYVIVLQDGQTTPAPWINVIANPQFGFQTSADGSGYTWAGNSRENQLTPWSNDPVTDPTGEVLYVRDEVTGKFWTATAHPIRDDGTYIARHGFGYSLFEHRSHGIALELLQYVPMADPVKISRLTVRNQSGWFRRLSITAYLEWVLGASRSVSAPFIISSIDDKTGAMLIRNPWNTAYPNRIVFADLGGMQSGWTANRTEFLGRHGDISSPQALRETAPLSEITGAGFDPCCALQRVIELGIDAVMDIVLVIGQANSITEAQALITRYRHEDLHAKYQDVLRYWTSILSTVQVATPDRAMDIMLNGWLLYQTVVCRLWARSAFYQASGAYGFRDQLQDGMALSFALPAETRSHILRAAARQFPEGDVQHWWLPQNGLGVRTQISDDRLWLVFATATYLSSSGDLSILDEQIPFLEGPSIASDEHDLVFQPQQSAAQGSLYEHCVRGLEQTLALTGEHGLPLMGTGDWNDGMNRVGELGLGESVWLGWFLITTIDQFIPFAQQRQDPRASHWIEHAHNLRHVIEQTCWDGAWYRRARFDDGTWLGSAENDECRIDSIAQSWSVLSGTADPAHAAAAMASLTQYLVHEHDRLILLFAPPFDQTDHDPGYIRSYPPGLRENGGQYSHAATWAILAFVAQGNGDQAANLFAMLNPIHHTQTEEDWRTYKVEPYVMAADVYSVAPHTGRGGWTWYTGAAGWMYRAGIEGILGLQRHGDTVTIQPCIPADWPGFTATIQIAATRYTISIEHTSHRNAVSAAWLDGSRLELIDSDVRIQLDGKHHTVRIMM